MLPSRPLSDHRVSLFDFCFQQQHQRETCDDSDPSETSWFTKRLVGIRCFVLKVKYEALGDVNVKTSVDSKLHTGSL